MDLVIARTWDGHPAGDETFVRLTFREALHIEVDAPYLADPPPAGPPGPTDRLWEHEVVEVFVAGPGDDDVPYTEIELSPHGHHLVLRFVGVRRRIATLLPLDFSATILGDRWSGVARLDPALLPPRPWRVNACAIRGGRHLSAAPLPKLDFHAPARFTGWAPN